MADLIDRQAAIVTAVRAAIDWHKLANPQYSIAYCIGEAMKQLPSAQAKLDENDMPEQGDSAKFEVKTGETCTDCISRQDAIDALRRAEALTRAFGYHNVIETIRELPSAQPERRFDEWCNTCKEYDQEKHCCPRFNHVIRTTLQDVQRTGRWIPVAGRMGKEVQCDCCGEVFWYWLTNFTYCPNCGAKMEDSE